MPSALATLPDAVPLDGNGHGGIDITLGASSSNSVGRSVLADFFEGDAILSRKTSCLKTAFSRSADEEVSAGEKEAAEAKKKGEGEKGETSAPLEKGIICGVASGDGHSDGSIVCGIPMYREHHSGAPFILPIGQQSAVQEGVDGETGGGDGGAAAYIKAAISGRLRSEAFEIMKNYFVEPPPPQIEDYSGRY